MTVQDLQVLFDYGYWANRRLIAAMSGLSPEQFARTLDGSHGSIRNTLVHILSAEWGWLERCGGPARGARLNPLDFPTVESLIVGWSGVERDMRRFLLTLPDDELTRKIEFTIGTQKHSMPVVELLQHSAHHAVHHRGQVSLLLRLLGRDPDDFDILLYHAERLRLH